MSGHEEQMQGVGLGITEAVAQRRFGITRGEFLRRASAAAVVGSLAGSTAGSGWPWPNQAQRRSG